jgi:hypothetical protein
MVIKILRKPNWLQTSWVVEGGATQRNGCSIFRRYSDDSCRCVRSYDARNAIEWTIHADEVAGRLLSEKQTVAARRFAATPYWRR